ncbi:4-alpha-glucanotransferase, partial [Falsiroseomonas oryzae]|uniref:4-alpha-glucanotransferase n=1 Tax=Falsiroseomonas oryzae TaxID=2766473 RepID=UPI0022EADD64
SAPARGDPALLARLAEAAGIAPHWHAISGERHAVPEDTLRALLGALLLPAGNDAEARESLAVLSRPRALPQALTAQRGNAAVSLPLSDRRLRLRIRLEAGGETALDVAPEDGATRRILLPDGRGAARRLVPLPAVPEGRHLLFDEAAPEAPCHLAIVPRQAFLPTPLDAGGRRFGIAAQIYALRRAGDQGIGDFTAVAEIARLAQAQGAGFLGLSPPHALFPTDRARASPYHPADRRFLDPIFLDVTALPLLGDLPALRAALDAQAPAFSALAARDAVDHAGVWDAKRAVLHAAWRALPAAHP